MSFFEFQLKSAKIHQSSEKFMMALEKGKSGALTWSDKYCCSISVNMFSQSEASLVLQA